MRLKARCSLSVSMNRAEGEFRAAALDAGGRGTALLPIIFVRHGETDWNRAGRLQGSRTFR
jgi:hypothetical protein